MPAFGPNLAYQEVTMHCTGFTCARCNLIVRRCLKPDVARKLDLMPKSDERGHCRAWQIGIEKKAHAELGGRQRVKGFLLRKFADESERRPNIFGGKVVLALDIFKSHAAGQAPHNHRYRYASTANNGLAVSHGRVNDNAVRSDHGASDDTSPSQASARPAGGLFICPQADPKRTFTLAWYYLLPAYQATTDSSKVIVLAPTLGIRFYVPSAMARICLLRKRSMINS